MRRELPQFKRCCMFLPLRHGLILWGYIRLVIGGLLLVGSTKGFFYMLRTSKTESGYEIYVVMFGFFVILSGTDIVLNVVFVIAEHTKDLQMVKAYYIYSFVLWILMIIMTGCVFVYGMHVIRWETMDFLNIWVVICDLLTLFAQIMIQAYVLLLLRSEFIKQKNNCEFRFVNNAAESACSMKYIQDNIANEDYKANKNQEAKEDYTADEDYKTNENYKFNEYFSNDEYKEKNYKHGTSESK